MRLAKKYDLLYVDQLQRNKVRLLRDFDFYVKSFKSPKFRFIPGNIYYIRTKSEKLDKSNPGIFIFVLTVVNSTIRGINLTKYNIENKVEAANIFYTIDPDYFEKTSSILEEGEQIKVSRRYLELYARKDLYSKFIEILSEPNYSSFRLDDNLVTIVPLKYWDLLFLKNDANESF